MISFRTNTKGRLETWRQVPRNRELHVKYNLTLGSESYRSSVLLRDREFIVDRASLLSVNTRARRICDSRSTGPDVELTDIRRAGKIRTIQTTDKPQRTFARITALIRDNRATLSRIKGVSLFMVTQLRYIARLQISTYVIPIASASRALAIPEMLP